MIKNAKQWLSDNYEDMLLDLADLIGCPSVKSTPEFGKPFGAGCYDALMSTKATCEKFGFTFHEVDGYVGYIDYEDTGMMPEYGIMCHVDVVPPCNFTTDPYALVRKNGKLIARGIMDDKGPCMIMIYVLAALKQAGFVPKHNVRLLFGCDEESGWEDIDYAKEKGVIPRRGYSPDADYPLINREKGITTVELQKSLTSDVVASFLAGEASNAVPDICKMVLNLSMAQVKELFDGASFKWQAEEAGSQTKVTVFGTASHASMPHQGKNAAVMALATIGKLDTSFGKIAQQFDGTKGKGLGFANPNLTCTLSKVHYGGKTLNMVVDIRYPHDIEFNKVDIILREALLDFQLEYKNHKPCHSVDEKDPLCVCLLKAYEMETGEKGEPMSIGGGTFARAFEVGVAFGCTFPTEPMCAHMADEFMLEDSVKKNLDIQLQAVYQLCGSECEEM